MSEGQLCSQCRSHSLDHFGHHKMAPMWFLAQQNLRTVEFCQSACLGAQLEAGSRLGHEAWQSRPADILIETLQVACVMPGSTAMQAE